MVATKKKIKTFAFDFDGVIAKYDGVFKGEEHLGKPHKEVVKTIIELKKQGEKILIYSSRGSKVLRKYCKKYKIPFTYINRNPEYKTGNPGKPVASVYVDDRAFCYTGQKAKQLIKKLKEFEVYYKK